MKRPKWFATVLGIAIFTAIIAAPITHVAGQPIKMTLWSGYPEMKPYFEAATKYYNELHPNVTIEISTFPLREVERKYAVSLPTKSGPDIVESRKAVVSGVSRVHRKRLYVNKPGRSDGVSQERRVSSPLRIGQHLAGKGLWCADPV